MNLSTRTLISLQEIHNEGNKLNLRQILRKSNQSSGGTQMYLGLNDALRALQSSKQTGIDSWIVCLTDGQSNNSGFVEFRTTLTRSSPNLHLAIIGVNLFPDYQQQLRDICSKFGTASTPGIFVPSDANINSMNQALGEVAARIPVSQTFELDGELSD